jgi:excisionase family DNA binding protein
MKWLSVKELASYMGISKGTVYRKLKANELPAHRVGKLWKFDKAEIDEWIKRSSPDRKLKQDC